MSDRQSLELERPRDLSELFGGAWRFYRSRFRLVAGLAAAVVVPVNLIVLGIGLEQLTSDYDGSTGPAETAIAAFVTNFVTTPLIAAMVVLAMLELSAGGTPTPGATLQRALEVFPAVFFALLIMLAGILLGLILLIVPGIYVAVRWYFVTQSVVVDGVRGAAALRRSWELVAGNWWRVLAIGVVSAVVVAVAGVLLVAPFEVAAVSADHALPSLVGRMFAETLATPFGVLILTLLYFDLRWRHRQAQVPGGVPGSADEPAAGPPDPPGLPPR